MNWLIRHRLEVRFRDCDPLGHVNNAVFLTYLEQARFTLWRAQLGYVARGTMAGAPGGAGFILARAECDFKAQARYGDQLEVRLGLARVGRSSFDYDCEIADVSTSRIVLVGRTVQVLFDYEGQRPIAIGDELKTKLALKIGDS